MKFPYLVPILAATLVTAPFNAPAALVGLWTFNDETGSVAVDSSGFGNNGALLGDEVFSVVGNQGLVSSEGAGTINWGNPETFDLTTSLSLAVWVNPTGSPSGGNGETALLGADTGYALSYYTNGRTYFYIGGGANNISAALPANEWSLVTGTWDGTTMALYVNGIEVANRGQASPIASPSGDFRSGLAPGSFTAGFVGQLDEARLYDSALSAGEVLSLYQAGPVPVPEPAVVPVLLGGLAGLWLLRRGHRTTGYRVG